MPSPLAPSVDEIKTKTEYEIGNLFEVKFLFSIQDIPAPKNL